MSTREKNSLSAVKGLQYSLKEFMAEWDTLKRNVDLFLRNPDSGEDSGMKVKMSSYRLSILSAEILAFSGRIKKP